MWNTVENAGGKWRRKKWRVAERLIDYSQSVVAQLPGFSRSATHSTRELVRVGELGLDDWRSR